MNGNQRKIGRHGRYYDENSKNLSNLFSKDCFRYSAQMLKITTPLFNWKLPTANSFNLLQFSNSENYQRKYFQRKTQAVTSSVFQTQVTVYHDENENIQSFPVIRFYRHIKAESTPLG